MFPLIAFLLASTAALESFEKPYYDLNDAHNLFQNFVQEHGKLYEQEEYLYRLEIFKDNLVEINERNAIYTKSVFAITRVADLTAEERKTRYSTFGNEDDINVIEELVTEVHLSPEEITAPEQWDWREHGIVSHVKDQGDCGSCWIFSATGAIEGQYAIKHNKSLAFSEQQSLDCVGYFCTGGWPHTVMAYHEKFGIVLEKGYPYIGKQATCHEDPEKVITKVSGYEVYKSLDEETLKQFVYQKGPLSVAVDYEDFFFHKKGMLYPSKCKDNIGHAMLLVGYGIENGTKYWILKDSYGLQSGDQGYFKLVRGINACSMGTMYTAACTVE